MPHFCRCKTALFEMVLVPKKEAVVALLRCKLCKGFGIFHTETLNRFFDNTETIAPKDIPRKLRKLAGL